MTGSRPMPTQRHPRRWHLAAAWAFCCLAVLLTANSASGLERDYMFDRVDPGAGLLQSTVRHIYQDHTGYLWVATQGGLHQYDGYAFRLYQPDPENVYSIPDSVVSAIDGDDKGRIWIGTATAGVARLDPATDHFEAFALPPMTPEETSRSAITALMVDAARGVLLGTKAGMEVLDPGDGRRQRLRWSDGTPVTSVVRGFARDDDGDIWAISEQGMLRLALGSTVAEAVHEPLLENANDLLIGKDGAVYVATNHGLLQMDRGSGKVSHRWPAEGSQPVHTLGQDHSGRIWFVSAGAGLSGWDPLTGEAIHIEPDATLPGALPNAQITSLRVDRGGLLWVGSETRGLSKMDPNGATFRYVLDRDPQRADLGGNNIRAILEDPHGDLWLGTIGDGLKRYDRREQRFEHFASLIAEALAGDPHATVSILALAPGNDGQIWFASNFGIGLLDPRKQHVSRLPPALNGAIPPDDRLRRTLLKSRDGSLWFSTGNNGVIRYQPDADRWQSWRHRADDPHSLSDNRVYALHEDRQGLIWAGSMDGLNIIDPADGSLRVLRHDKDDRQSLSGNIVRSIHESADGSFWIGTHNGLNHLPRLGPEPARFTRYLLRDGLPDATIYSILEDRFGRLWMGTNRGVATLNIDSGRFWNYSLRDGLQGAEFNGGAAFVLADGDFAFGGINGLNLVTPSAPRAALASAAPVITQVDVGPRSFRQPAADQVLNIGPDDRALRVNYASLDFRAPENNHFSYQLEGFDPVWIDAGTRHEATYTNLAPGDYVFRVRAGAAGSTPASISVRVHTWWWAQPAMQLLYLILAALALLLAGYLIRKRRTERALHHRALMEREDRLRLALWGSGDQFWSLDLASSVLTRIGSDQLLGGEFSTSISLADWKAHSVHTDDLLVVEQRLADCLSGKADAFESEHRLRNEITADWIWVSSRGKIVERDSHGAPLRVAGTARNITASRAAERNQRISQEVIRSMGEAVSVADLDFRFVSVNPAFTRITGWQEAEIRGRNASVLNCAQHSSDHYQSTRDVLMREGHWQGEIWQRRKNGEEFLCWLQNSEVRDVHGERTHYVSVLTDITERKRNEQELRYLANYDTLTGLPNRTLLSERLGRAVVRARRANRMAAVLFLDLDRFKHVNDSMGHAAGDRMLKAAGARLRQQVRDTDTVARIGGDEFTIVLEEINDASEAERIAQSVLHAFAQPLELGDGQDVVISPSIGISLFPDHGRSPTDLLKYADTAMYQAKDRGRNTYMMYTATMDVAARLRATTVGALRKALERNEFSLVYQPKQSLHDERITGVEVLLRWHSSELGEVPPSVFIPIAEEIGLIIDIGDWVLNQACAEFSHWQRIGLRDVNISVNLSVSQLLHPDLIQRLCDTLADNDMAPGQLELELTESMVMANAEQSITTLRQLKAIGVTLSIDDFGTGYSSLSYLKRLPIDTLKIDKEFVGDITFDPDDEAITATVITMAHSLRLNVIAEGVETAAQVEYLRAHGCDEIQGHWLSKPLPAQDCLAFLLGHAQHRRELRERPR